MYEYKGTVDRIIDGDTVDIILDLGFSTYRKVRCRLARVDTLEAGTSEGGMATEFLRSLLTSKSVIIQSKKLDRYGRAIAEIWLDGKNVSDQILFNQSQE